jgi:hypothetical protein
MDFTNLLNPQAFYLLIPILLLLAFLTFRNFVSEDIGDRRERKRFRIIFLVIRSLIVILLVIALAKPFGEITVTTPGDPKLIILVDKSNSMDVMETGFFDDLKADLEKQFPVSVKEIGSGTKSGIGDEILGYLEQNTNLLLVSDGRSNYGSGLVDVSLLAAT